MRLILITLFFSQAQAQQGGSLNISATNYFNFKSPPALDQFKPLANATDFLKVLENRKLVDIDTEGQYIYLYGVGIDKGTTTVNGEILHRDRFKVELKNGVNLKNFVCTYGVCTEDTTKIDCGPDKYMAYEGGFLIYVNSCGSMHMFFNLRQEASATTKPRVEEKSEPPVEPVSDKDRFD